MSSGTLCFCTHNRFFFFFAVEKLHCWQISFALDSNRATERYIPIPLTGNLSVLIYLPLSKTAKSMEMRVMTRFVSLIMYAFELKACWEFGSLMVSPRLLSLPIAGWLLLLIDMYSLKSADCEWLNADADDGWPRCNSGSCTCCCCCCCCWGCCCCWDCWDCRREQLLRRNGVNSVASKCRLI